MIFTEPMPFEEAIAARRAKALLPTDLDTEQLNALPVEVREMASFSAAVVKAEYLQVFDDLTVKIAGGATPEDFERRAAGGGPLITDFPAARLAMKRYLRSVGYQAKAGEEGTIKDLSTDRRIDLKLETDVRMVQGYGNYSAGQNPATLDGTPCQEFIRVSRRRRPRLDWAQRWAAAGGRTFGGGRMIAAKDDPVWVKLSRFGQPYEPFDFGSGMGLRNVRRPEAVALGVIPQNYRVQPDDRRLTDNLQASAAGFSAALQGALETTGYVIKDGVLTLP